MAVDCFTEVTDLDSPGGCPGVNDLLILTNPSTGLSSVFTWAQVKACANSFAIQTVIVPDNTPDPLQLNTIQVDSLGNQWFVDSYGDVTKIENAGLAETDPVFMASPAQTILSGDITNWDAAYAAYLLLGSMANQSTSDYYTNTNIDNFFAGTGAPAGYNKTNWDNAFAYTNSVPNFTTSKILFGDGDTIPSTDTLLHWDNTAKSLALGTATPSTNTRLTIVTHGDTSSYYATRMYQTNGTTEIFSIRADGNITSRGVKMIMGDVSQPDFPTFIEFVKGNGAGAARAARTSMGSLGTLELNFSSNMDYQTIPNDHRYYDSAQIAAWMYLSNTSDIFGIQYVPGGNSNAADIYTAYGCRPFYVSTFNQPGSGKGINGFSNTFSAVYNFADTNNTSVSTAAAATIRLTAGELLYASPSHRFTGTQSASFPTGINVSFASAAAAAFYAAMDIRLTAGYTGSTKNTHAAIFYNLVAGTGSNLRLYTSFTEQDGNTAASFFANNGGAATNGSCSGGISEALNGLINVGHIHKAVTARNSGTNIGSINVAYNSGSSPVQVGSFHGLKDAAVPTVSAAIIVDNGTSTDPVSRFKVAGVDRINILPTGILSFIGSANNRANHNRILYGATTDAATAVELTTDGAAGSGATNRIAVPADTTLSIVLNIVVKQSGSANSKQMLRQVVIANNGGTTAIEGTVIALGTDSGSAGLATVTCTITANNTDDCLKVEANGILATNLRYSCFVVSTEVLYA